ncbi:hypothetical protein DFJ43DRAFT_1162547 [Lentinula guzmanii]|uniref:Uncharacterized protein n=1 Tax=Lentinula guzmanii TaxID=2804957 RepID=A0AA38MU31_9AGAR|nr:hypothetical protein DFJ43DRAFT_1162547 [Lentinula guzmanii]
MAGLLPVLQLDASKPLPPAPPSAHPSGVYMGPFMDGWVTGRFIVCPHTCKHTMNPRVNPAFQHVFTWPVNISGRSYDHTRNAKFHGNCAEGCPGHQRFGSGNVLERRPATLAETIRGVIDWSLIVHSHRGVLQKRELAWVERVESGEDLTNPQLRALWNAAPQLPPLHPSPYSNYGIGPDSNTLQFQDIPTHLSQSMRPFDLTAALCGEPAMPGSTVPGPGPVICGYYGWGAPSLQPDPPASPRLGSSHDTAGPSRIIRAPLQSPVRSNRTHSPTPGPSNHPHSLAQQRTSYSPEARFDSPVSPGPHTPARRAPSYHSRQALSPMPETQDTPRGLFSPIPDHNTQGASRRSTASGELSPTPGAHLGSEGPLSDAGGVEPDDLDEFRTLAIRDNKGLGRGLSLRWSELEGDISRLPKRTLFLLDDQCMAPKPLKTFVTARLMQEKTFYWCILKWQMTYERRRLFHAMYQKNLTLQRAMYFHITVGGSFLNAELYVWEWITLALLLWEQGGHVDFMLTSDFCKMLQRPGDMPVEWERMKNYEFVFFGGSSDPSNELTKAQHRNLQVLVKNSIQIWPHPLSVKVVLQKSVIHGALSGTIREAGGYVIKRDCSFESRHVFLPKREPYMSHAGEDATARARGYEDLFRQAWNLNVSGYKFFAIKYNPSLLMLGEVRTFITFGQVIELIHTIPEDPVLKRDEMLHERCHGSLNDVTKMTKPERGRYLDFSQQRRRQELWHLRDLALDNTGTNQLIEFALKVYHKLIDVEESINRTNQFYHGIAGHKVCVRLDIGVIWDCESDDPKDHRYRFILNEIQPGDSGLFMIDKDARAGVPYGVIDGILRGSLAQ